MKDLEDQTAIGDAELKSSNGVVVSGVEIGSPFEVETNDEEGVVGTAVDSKSV